MSRSKKILLAITILATGILVYTPHRDYPYPLHVDEWHHIAQALRIGAGEYVLSLQSAEIGFQIFLYLLGSLTNLVLIYQYLPAFWAILSSGALAWTLYRSSGKNWTIILSAVIAFASIKSNVNILGLWFFTPLSFAIPLIYLYTYFLTVGIAENNRRFLLIGTGIASLLLFIHAISVFFALPFLLWYLYLHRKTFTFKRYLALWILGGGICGVLFATSFLKLPFGETLLQISKMLTFPYGWGVVELQNTYTEFYSTTGILLALLGSIYLLKHPKRRAYAWYLLWPATLIIMILMFRITGYSFLSPYQRNLYYLALALPPLSAFGVYYGHHILSRLLQGTWWKPYKKQLFTVISCVLLYGMFANYHILPEQAQLYRAISKEDFQALQFLSTLPKSQVMAEALPSIAIYPVAGHDPVASLTFDGKHAVNDNFMYEENCAEKREVSWNNPQVKYLLSRTKLYCGWVQLYAKKRYVYQLHP